MWRLLEEGHFAERRARFERGQDVLRRPFVFLGDLAGPLEEDPQRLLRLPLVQDHVPFGVGPLLEEGQGPIVFLGREAFKDRRNNGGGVGHGRSFWEQGEQVIKTSFMPSRAGKFQPKGRLRPRNASRDNYEIPARTVARPTRPIPSKYAAVRSETRLSSAIFQTFSKLSSRMRSSSFRT